MLLGLVNDLLKLGLYCGIQPALAGSHQHLFPRQLLDLLDQYGLVPRHRTQNRWAVPGHSEGQQVAPGSKV